MGNVVVKKGQFYINNEVELPLDEILPIDRVVTIDNEGNTYLYDACITINKDMIEKELD